MVARVGAEGPTNATSFQNIRQCTFPSLFVVTRKMDSIDVAVESLRFQIVQTEAVLKNLKFQLAEVEKEQQQHSQPNASRDLSHAQPQTPTPPIPVSQPNGLSQTNGTSKWPLEAENYKRYGRQLILPQVGLQGQLNLTDASVLVVGVGGLGCPAAAYLAAAGVGTIGLIDGDIAEISNLHRQIIHTSSTVGKHKVDSAVQYLRELNPLPKYNSYPKNLSPDFAVELFKDYDIILDCTDRPTSRYLISDAAVLAGNPIVSGSALGTEGQLLVLNDGSIVQGKQPRKFCYRCVFPKPPPPETVLSCGEGGIFGPVVGVMGVLMATEVLKLLIRDTYDQQPGRSYRHIVPEQDIGGPPDQPSMLLYSATSEPMFRTVRVKGKREDCLSCSCSSTLSQESLTSGSVDYAVFCGLRTPTSLLEPEERCSPEDFIQNSDLDAPGCVFLVDVRPKTEFDLGHISGSINAPIQDLEETDYGNNVSDTIRQAELKRRSDSKQSAGSIFPHAQEKYVYIICRQGNDSQRAAKTFQRKFPGIKVCDIIGGLDAWRKTIDPTFPDY
ncbi:MAG: hypothetical protein Q9181_004458 [Wetmoreana brouardii]